MLIALSGACKSRYREVEVSIDEREPIGAPAAPATSTRFALATMLSPRQTAVDYERLLELLGDVVGERIALIHGKSYAEVNDQLRAGRVAFALLCTGGYVALAKSVDRVPLVAIPVVDGKKTYRSLIVVRRDSEIDDFGQLEGRRFAFVEPLSLTGYRYPLQLLRALGTSRERFFGAYSFAGSHDRAIRAVTAGAAEGAAVYDLVFHHLAQRQPETVAQLKVIHRSEEYPIPPLVASPRTNAAQRGRWRRALLSLHLEPSGASLLERVGVDRFVAPDPAVYRAMLDRF